MEAFSNDTLDTFALPRFENATLSDLHPKYWIVQLLSIFAGLTIGVIALIVAFFNSPGFGYFTEVAIAYLILATLVVFMARISFKKKRYAFREHDVILQYGIISTNTIIIPYNRIQHVALHEGILSRRFGLAAVRVYTAGGSGSDIEIPGIERARAEDIKHLLVGKIQAQL